MHESMDLEQVELRIGYRFRDRRLLQQALTHRSWVEERYPGGAAPSHESQQRPEFLGDAFLSWVVGHWLYLAFPLASEGELTRRRVQFTSGKWLAEVGARLELVASVRCGKGQQSILSENRRLPADTLEALIGAIVLDGGPDAATAFIHSWLPREPPALVEDQNPIIVFNEWYQRTFGQSPPKPSCTSEGPDHARVWTCCIVVEGYEPCEGSGASLQMAKAEACKAFIWAHGI